MYQQYIRQQTTTNDYCRQQTFNQRLSLDKGCYFASSNQSRGDTTKQPYSLITKHTHYEYNEKFGHADWPPGCRT